MKAKTKSIPQKLDKEKCITYFNRYGFFIHTEEPNKVILRKTGTEFSIDGEKFPKELSIQFNDDSTVFSLKYDTFVLFDTGDLDNEFGKMMENVEQNIEKLSAA